MTASARPVKADIQYSPLHQPYVPAAASTNNSTSATGILGLWSKFCCSTMKTRMATASVIMVVLVCIFIAFSLVYSKPVNATLCAQPSQPASITRAPLQNMDLLFESKGRIRFKGTKRHLPQCIIIGVRKCGTRALLVFLNLHSHIQVAQEEVHFFDKDDNYDMGLEWYRKKMPYSFPNQVTVEKSPAYFITPEVPGRIYHMNSSAKLIVIFRDPTTRVISDYAQILDNKKAKGKAEDWPKFEDIVMNDDGSINTEYKAVRISIYHRHLRRWLEVFDLNQIHIVDGDKLITDPVSEISKIETFLGLDHQISEENLFFDRRKGFYCMRNKTEEKCLNETKGRKHPDIDDGVLKKLQNFFVPHNRKLFKMIGRKFDWPEP
ncbi:heparan sulfate glucosamine 3-O-sulfotransferase 5 [Lingula anatina]|uniref:Heparan sulfate glucosamine 3-O-sulfotransferase 5 n=1 Tax=Lingula anatina TaxID=7574 RepID=A0A1S3ICN9_LINAN|nr:heparan sulfate glucosamine 3-O-sulfotransferase 5 [Lingula anatina]XP_013396020.1 heparan sulfate glucosamine 3-O-sulfotransferase 5 [Lingula anatina]XP_013396021.1 heparan sulfate glucosamine 3-O-sulfotransferase 5 [Lingula anatina]XP_013396022.1 heparan sulfate glucosamine 3-O-sulfotransferase 5 [Lingula anatina]XP_013396023.1 heparan sulfate glucosamine 3-O-sulfotransferase 5 [Lingula anatina]XP_013396024.1 heparan sulfate glucosamine 3-O-sulfotransferase 5 [Lingula anatina]XP_01339602|eukprot:XP_013396019.1 heparan sulfate glucosamine 3-O-sulfotransferase 5 [Lingula anatina]